MSIFNKILKLEESKEVKIEENPKVAAARELVRRSDWLNEEIRKCKNALYVLEYAQENPDKIQMKIPIPGDRRTLSGMYSGYINYYDYDLPIEACDLLNIIEITKEYYKQQIVSLERELKNTIIWNIKTALTIWEIENFHLLFLKQNMEEK